MRMNPEQGTEFAKMLVAEDEPLADLNQVCESLKEVCNRGFEFFFFFPLCWADRGCVHGDEYGSAMHVFPS